jgi:hypothetical protein
MQSRADEEASWNVPEEKYRMVEMRLNYSLYRTGKQYGFST